MNRLLLILLALIISTPAHGLVIELRSAAEVDSDVVKLGDIATFDEETDLSRALAGQQVGHTASPGQSITLDSRAIVRNISNMLDQNSQVEWRGPITVQVTQKAVQISSARILQIIDSYIRENSTELPQAKFSFIPTDQPLPFTLPTGKLTWEIIPSDPDLVDTSRFSIIFRVDGRVKKNMSVRGNMKVLSQVVVAADSLSKGKLLTRKDLTMKTEDISSLRSPSLDPEQVIGKKLTRSIRKGQPIATYQVKSPPLIKKGDLVRIIFKRGSLMVTARGLARNDGLFDETIRVQNTTSHKIVYCRVAGPGVVEVAL